MPYVNRDGVNIYYESYGQGVPIVFLHPYSSNSGIWLFQLFTFARNHCCIAIDARGQGRSDKPTTGHSIDEMAADVKAVLDELKIERAIFVGNSGGGMITMQFNLDYPERVIGNLLLSTATGLADNMPDEGREAFDDYLAGGSFSSIVDSMLSPSTKKDKPEIELLMNALFDLEDNFPSHAFKATAEDPRGVFNWNITERLPEIDKPTLVLAGAEDLAAGLNTSRVLAEKIPNAELKILEGIGHFCQLEAPMRFNQELAEFIKRVDST